jgi:hypothetical protein
MEAYNSLDLCCAPQCVGARITDREDLEGVHEPSHRLVKFRTTVLMRSQGRVFTAARDALKRVEETRREIANLTSHPDETRPGEVEGKSARDTREDRVESLPTCGKCDSRLSFPFWYCIFCEG